MWLACTRNVAWIRSRDGALLTDAGPLLFRAIFPFLVTFYHCHPPNLVEASGMITVRIIVAFLKQFLKCLRMECRGFYHAYALYSALHSCARVSYHSSGFLTITYVITLIRCEISAKTSSLAVVTRLHALRVTSHSLTQSVFVIHFLPLYHSIYFF